MATAKEGQEHIGLLANGCSGPWEVQIDETTAGADRWFAQIEGPLVYLYFEIPSLDIIDKAVRFLAPQPTLASGLPVQPLPGNGSLVIGKDRKSPVVLVRDDEFGDRYFLVIGQAVNPMVRFSIAGKDLEQIAAALRQAREDLNDT